MTFVAAPAPAAPAAAEVLGRVRELRTVEAQAARVTMQLVAAWAGAHPAPGLEDLPVGEVYADHEVELAGPGAPGVSQFALVELATALGLSTRAGAGYVGDVIELAHRLPGIWARVGAGHLPAWRARTIAQRTKQLSAAAAAWVDERLAPVAHKVGPVKVGRLIEKALVLFDLETAVEQTMAEQHVTITPLPAGDGLVDLATVHATLQLDDALALEAAIASTAHTLVTDHPHRCLDERRALALGALADHALAHAPGDGPVREVSVVVHLGEAELGRASLARIQTAGTGPGAGRGGPAVVDRLITTDAVAAWCTHPRTRVIIKPVLDPTATDTSCGGYVPSARLRDQVTALSPTCAFPYCTVPAEGCDLDHIQAWAAGGTTSALNLAPCAACTTGSRPMPTGVTPNPPSATIGGPAPPPTATTATATAPPTTAGSAPTDPHPPARSADLS